MKTYDRILKYISEQPWALHPAKMEQVIGVIEARMAGVDLSTDRWQALQERRSEIIGHRQGVAVLGLHGTISHKVGLLEGSGGTSTEAFGQALKAAVNDSAVSSIVVDIDSPGGSVYGVPELASAIRSYRGRKPMIGVANAQAFSAAYCLGTAFDQLVVTPSGEVGSVGVMTAHVDVSKWNEEQGIKVTYIHAGKYKVEGNPDEPLSEEALASYQASVDKYYAMFVNDLAKNRGVSAETVEKKFGQGRTVMAADAVKLGMADRVATLEQVLEEQAGSRSGLRYKSAKNRRELKTKLDRVAPRA